MPLLCPTCAHPSLQTGRAIELPADHESDEITLETLRCSACGFLALGLEEESRRGSSDDCWRHGGYPTDAGQLARVESLIAGCPDPARRVCDCASHRALVETKDGLRRDDRRFPLRAARDVPETGR